MTDETRNPQPDTLSGPTTELTFLGPSHDGSRLLLGSPDGRRFELPVDGRLVAVVSREHRDAPAKQSTVVRKMPTPREIQDRIRHGEAIDDLAKSVGADTEEIARFANPVITERAHVATLARGSRVTTGSGHRELDEAVTARLRGRGIDVSSTLWDAWRRADGNWTVVLAYSIAQGTEVATFRFNLEDHSLEAVDEQARWLLELGETTTEPTQPAPTGERANGNGRWDREHPAARAAQRRESAEIKQQDAAQGLRPDEKWEELLFGTHTDE